MGGFMKGVAAFIVAGTMLFCASALAQAPERDPADFRPVLPTTMADYEARLSVLRTEVANLPSGSRSWGLKQIEYGYAMLAGIGEIDPRPGLEAARAALTVFTREREPVPWAHAQSLVAIFSQLQGRRGDARAASALALGVFTKDAHPLQYVELRCFQAMLRSIDASEDVASFWGDAFTALAPVCGGLVLGDGQSPSAARFHGAMRGSVVFTAAIASQLGPAFQRFLEANMDADDMGLEQLLETYTGARAGFLSGALALETLGLSAEQRRRALSLRNAADAAADRSGRSGPAWRANREMWRAYADYVDLLAAARPQANDPAPPPIPAVAPVMLSEERGVALYRALSGRGGVIPTFRGFSDGLLSRLVATRTQGATTIERSVESTAANAWMGDYARGDFAGAIARFRAAFEPRWTPAFREALRAAGVQRDGRVLILPDGAASMLPIGLLRDAETGRTLIEDYEIVLAPSVRLYRTSLERARGATARTLALIAPDEAETGLPFAEAETRLVATRFAPGATTRPASKDAVFDALQRASYWHFATHGAFDATNPRGSALQLPGRELLTLGDLLRTDRTFASPRLVVLSACETGLFDAALDPDEFFGLPSGFMQAGAAGVIASLWPVSDAATALLIGKVYALHLGEGLAPPAALRRAQLWLKDADKPALAAFVMEEVGRGALDMTRADRLLAEVRGASSERPFGDPVYWGAFVYYGT